VALALPQPAPSRPLKRRRAAPKPAAVTTTTVAADGADAGHDGDPAAESTPTTAELQATVKRLKREVEEKDAQVRKLKELLQRICNGDVDVKELLVRMCAEEGRPPGVGG
jgi:hypothetical protein